MDLTKVQEHILYDETDILIWASNISTIMFIYTLMILWIHLGEINLCTHILTSSKLIFILNWIGILLNVILFNGSCKAAITKLFYFVRWDRGKCNLPTITYKEHCCRWKCNYILQLQRIHWKCAKCTVVQTICQIKTKVHCPQLSTGRSSLTHKHITIFWQIWSRPSTSGSKDLKCCLDRFSSVLLRTAAHSHRTLRAHHTKT